MTVNSTELENGKYYKISDSSPGIGIFYVNSDRVTSCAMVYDYNRSQFNKIFVKTRFYEIEFRDMIKELVDANMIKPTSRFNSMIHKIVKEPYESALV